MNEAPTGNIDDSLIGTVAYAWEAHHAADWLESYARWERVRELFPDYAPPYVHGAVALREAGQLDEALSKLRTGAMLFPDSAQIATTLGACLDQMGRFHDASEWFETAIPRFPNNPEVAVDYMRLAHIRGDFHSVLRGEAITGRVHPALADRDQGVRYIIDTAWEQAKKLGLNKEKVGYQSIIQDPDDKTVMGFFVSVGENCELDLVQKHFGVDTLDLFRWCSTSLSDIVKAFQRGIFTHKKNIQSHVEKISYTFPLSSEEECQILAETGVDLQERRELLFEYIKRRDKILVYSSNSRLDVSQIEDLGRAIRRHGPSDLLVVGPARGQDEAGSVKAIRPGLMVGFLNQIGPSLADDNDTWDISFASWLVVCRSAYAVHKDSDTWPSEPPSGGDFEESFAPLTNSDVTSAQNAVEGSPIPSSGLSPDPQLVTSPPAGENSWLSRRRWSSFWNGE